MGTYCSGVLGPRKAGAYRAPLQSSVLGDFGDLVKGLAGDLFLDLRNIANGDDTDQPFVTIENQHTADFLFPHLFGDSLHIFIFEAPDDIVGYQLAGFGGIEVAPFGHSSQNDVTVGKRTDQTVVFANRYESDVQVFHLQRYFFYSCIRRNTLDVSTHDFANFHTHLQVGTIRAMRPYATSGPFSGLVL